MKLKSFNEHIHEAFNPNDERYSKIRKLGLSPEPEMDDRMHGLQDEWMNDEEITRLVSKLRSRTLTMINKWFPTDDNSDSTAAEHFEEYADMLGELGAEELGFLEYMALQHWNGYL